MGVTVQASIFREYDIRGVVGDTVDEGVAAQIGRAFGTYLARKGAITCVTGRDNRFSSESLQQATNRGLNEAGINVIDVGMVITPMVYYAQKAWDLGGSLMVTASHNPPQYNGFKMTEGPGSLYGEEIQGLYRLIQVTDFESGAGTVEKREISDAYREMIAGKIKLGPRRLGVVIDCGNGTAGPFAPGILEALGAEVRQLYCESDPTFPNHHPDPTKIDNVQDLIRCVLENRADLGLGLDGDGDRIGVVDDTGEIVWGDRLMILYAKELLERQPGSKVILDVKCSQVLYDSIALLGGQPIWSKTGHSLIKARMREEQALLAGEMSGHTFFADEYYGYDDAVYAAARVLRILSRTNRSLSALLGEFPERQATPEVRPFCSDDRKFEVVRKSRDLLANRYHNIDIDGIRFWVDDTTWGLIRASNTQPALIVRGESATIEGLDAVKQTISDTLKEVGGVEVNWETQGE
ncbi:MAG: phosphomannomutase/phosphoglucomutase [Armatimonadetes bacterium]|nr:phosphomannomutase/phosphoglucomutase [Armatimonadota bacterium]